MTGAYRDFFADTGFLLPYFFVACCKNDMVGMITCDHGPLDVTVIINSRAALYNKEAPVTLSSFSRSGKFSSTVNRPTVIRWIE